MIGAWRSRGIAALLLLGLLLACSHNPDKVPVEERSQGRLNNSGYYVVQAGDSLYSIAWNYGLDYGELARANNLRSPYTIRVGQRLKLSSQGASSSASSSSSHRKSTVSGSDQQASGLPASNPESWFWPVSAKLARKYSGGTSGNLHKGIDFHGEMGQPVLAAKSGKVVYAGKGLKAYGLLVIVKHDSRYLSAYAFNKGASVKEGDRVKRGQQIARMGARDGKQAILHFEIRRDGKTVDPLTLLPRR